jgi:hypothetical protein
VKPSLSIWLYWKGFIVNLEAWIKPNMDPCNSWCGHFGPTMFFFMITMKSNAHGLLWTNLWIWILCLGFGRSFLLMHYYVFVLMSSWRWKNWLWFKLWVLWNMKGLFQCWDLWRQDFKLSLWTFEFGGLYVCTTFLYGWYFPYDDQCHQNMDWRKNT